MPRFKELSKEERKGELAFDAWKELTDNVSDIRRKTIRNAEIFTKIYDNQWWKDIAGSEDAQWSSLLGQVEVFYTKAEVARWMLLWRTFNNEWGFALEDIFDVPVVRLEKIAKYATASNHAQELIDKARVLSRSDWDDEIAKLRGKPTKETCNHPNGFKKVEVCPTCGTKHNL